MTDLDSAGRDGIIDWWRELPLDRVTILNGADSRSLAESVDPVPLGAPAIAFYSLPTGRPWSAPDIVADIVAALESAAVDLTSLWLPDGGLFDGTSSLDRRALTEHARRNADDTPHFGPYLAALADAARVGESSRPRTFAPETRVAGAARVVASAYGRSACALVVDVPVGHAPTAVASAAEWVSAQGSIGVWLLGAGAAHIERFPTIRVCAPPVPDDVVTSVDRIGPLSYPPIEGHPHPKSEPEMLLHARLDRQPWATGREHNRGVRLADLSRPFTVDILWRSEGVVVEIDGVDHRAPEKYADDRVRDNQLQTHGFVVLRFTNEQVVSDPEHVVATIARVVTARRSKGIDR